MDFELLGWPDEGPTLSLDHRRFPYAGKFVMSNTGKAVARDDESIVGAVSFNEDRTAEAVMWLRYLSVRQDRQGERIGPRLAATTSAMILEQDYDRVSIAVNNPFAYQALYRAGFGFTGRTTGLAELVLQTPHTTERSDYERGLAEFCQRKDLSQAEREFLAHKDGDPPPEPVSKFEIDHFT